jgi:hypothetical protein
MEQLQKFPKNFPKKDFNEFGPFNYLGSMLLPLTINFYTHLELYNKIAINKIQEIFCKNFKMQCIYTIQVKMKRKAMSVV